MEHMSLLAAGHAHLGLPTFVKGILAQLEAHLRIRPSEIPPAVQAKDEPVHIVRENYANFSVILSLKSWMNAVLSFSLALLFVATQKATAIAMIHLPRKAVEYSLFLRSRRFRTK